MCRPVLQIHVRLVHVLELDMKDIIEVWVSGKIWVNRFWERRRIILRLISPTVRILRRFYGCKVYRLALDIWTPTGSSQP